MRADSDQARLWRSQAARFGIAMPHSCYQGVVILVRERLAVEARVLARCCFENMIIPPQPPNRPVKSDIGDRSDLWTYAGFAEMTRTNPLLTLSDDSREAPRSAPTRR